MLELAILIVILGLLFDYTNGFHDSANVVSTVIATRVFSPMMAIGLAGLLNTIGAIQTSGVAETIAESLVDSTQTSQAVVLAAVSGAIAWNFLTWYVKLPSSSTYALIGGLLGASWSASGLSSIFWNNILSKIVLPMILTPILGFALGFLLMKGLYHFFGKRHHSNPLFAHLQIGSASLVALAHGMNDAQKSMGIITLGLFASGYLATPQIPFWVVLACALTIGLGTATGGFRIVRTMGFDITRIEPIQGFAAECASSFVILSASFLGMPISSTQMIAGSITGVGSARSMNAVRWGVPQKIVLAWFFTLPGAGMVGALAYLGTQLLGL